jgi:hypothetical protein
MITIGGLKTDLRKIDPDVQVEEDGVLFGLLITCSKPEYLGPLVVRAEEWRPMGIRIRHKMDGFELETQLAFWLEPHEQLSTWQRFLRRIS